ncbi:hypothetical protein CHCC14821_3994 [Bacillus paralicheniformis]|nr:hypothetical protein CHCC14821_3994 [Bacillus paralicheniformis]
MNIPGSHINDVNLKWLTIAQSSGKDKMAEKINLPVWR